MTFKFKFIPNITTMFSECGALPSRFSAARSLGFQAVELQFPYELPKERFQQARLENNNLRAVLINSYPGDVSASDLGIAIFPTRVGEFKSSLEKTIEYAKVLGSQFVHVMSGKLVPGASSSLTEDCARSCFINNIKYAADRLQQENIVALIEGVNSRISVPGYFLNSTSMAHGIVAEINHPNLKLQLDIFHLQIMEGCLTENIKKFLPLTGHVQIAQVPNRGEPSSDGEINYDYVLRLLHDLNYEGYVGLEYIPSVSTEKSLRWVEKYGALSKLN